MVLEGYMGECVDMGLRHYLGRTVLLLALALAVGIMGGEERERGGVSAIEHQGLVRARA
jgi:hypothetical protein